MANTFTQYKVKESGSLLLALLTSRFQSNLSETSRVFEARFSHTSKVLLSSSIQQLNSTDGSFASSVANSRGDQRPLIL